MMSKEELKNYRDNCNGECEKCPYGWDVAHEVECLVNPTIEKIRFCYNCLIEIVLENMESGE